MTKQNPFSHSNPPPLKGETFKKLSLTIPDMTLTLREIVDRFVRKQPVPVIDGFSYDYEDEHDNITDEDQDRFNQLSFQELQNMDPADRKVIEQHNKQIIADTKKKYKGAGLREPSFKPPKLSDDMFETNTEQDQPN